MAERGKMRCQVSPRFLYNPALPSATTLPRGGLEPINTPQHFAKRVRDLCSRPGTVRQARSPTSARARPPVPGHTFLYPHTSIFKRQPPRHSEASLCPWESASLRESPSPALGCSPQATGAYGLSLPQPHSQGLKAKVAKPAFGLCFAAQRVDVQTLCVAGAAGAEEEGPSVVGGRCVSRWAGLEPPSLHF